MLDSYIKNITKKEQHMLRFFGVLFIIGGILHGLYLLGIVPEKNPYFLEQYFNTLAVLDCVAGAFLIYQRNISFKIGIILLISISISNILANTYMIYLDTYTTYDSGYPAIYRLLDVEILIFMLWYVRKSYISQH